MISMDYSGKNYIVTGGAGGIGGAVVGGLLSGGGRWSWWTSRKAPLSSSRSSTAPTGWSSAKFEDLTQQEWDRVMTINLTGVFASVQSLFSHMKERRYGRIVVVASVAAQCGPTTDQAGLG